MANDTESLTAGVRDVVSAHQAMKSPVVPDADDTTAQCVMTPPVPAVNGPNVSAALLLVDDGSPDGAVIAHATLAYPVAAYSVIVASVDVSVGAAVSSAR